MSEDTKAKALEEERAAAQQCSDACYTQLEWAVKNDTKVKGLMDSIQKLGCKLPEDFFTCGNCPPQVSGGFTLDDKKSEVYKPQLVMCQNHQLRPTVFSK